MDAKRAASLGKGKRPDKTALPLSFGGINRIRFKGSTVRSLSDSAPSDASTLTKKRKECNRKIQNVLLGVVRQFIINLGGLIAFMFATDRKRRIHAGFRLFRHLLYVR